MKQIPVVMLTVSAFKGYLRSRAAIFFSLFVPLMIMGIFGVLNFGGSASVAIGVVDQAHTSVSEGLVTGLRQFPAVKLHTEGLAAERAALDKGDRDLVVVLPSTLGNGPTAVTAYFNQGRPQNSQVAMALMSRFLDEASLRVAGVQPSFTLAAQPVRSRNLTYVDFLVPGVIAMSLMQTGLFSVVFVFVQLKQRGILRRLMVTPMRVIDFLFAQVTTRLCMVALQTVVLLAVGQFVFRLHFSGNLFSLLLTGIMGGAVFVAMGFAISGYSKDENTAAPIANLIALPMMFLSGVFFPRGSMPDWLQVVTQYLPLTYVSDALRSISLDGATLWAVRFDLLGILAWLAVSVVVATRLFRWEVA